MSGAVCSAFATAWYGGTSCENIQSNLHWDSWFQKDGKNGYFQIEYAKPQVVISFNAQAFKRRVAKQTSKSCPLCTLKWQKVQEGPWASVVLLLIVTQSLLTNPSSQLL